MINNRFKDKLIGIIGKIGKYRTIVMSLAVVVVFVTTYMLILPALTLEKTEAEKQGGIDIGTEASEDVSDEKSDAVTVDEDETVVEPSGKKDTSDVKKTDKKAKADTAKDAPSDPLTFEGEGFSVAVEDKAGILPEKTSIEATELIENPTEGTKAERKTAAEEYRNYYDKALEAIKDEAKGETDKKISFVKFYDITLQSGDEAIQPEKPVNVTISYDEQQQKELKVEEKKDVRIIHFAKDEETGEITAEIIDDKNVDVTLEKSLMTDTTFEAEGFSVYGIVYTVDFHWEVNGQTYDFSIPGGGFVSFSQLVEVLGLAKQSEEAESSEDVEDARDNTAVSGESAESALIMLDDVVVSDATKEFVSEVKSIKFSNPDLVWIGKVNETTTVGALKEANGLDVIYSLELTKEQITEINAQTVEAGDWALISLQPFDTEETLTITMTTGETFVIKVTDAKDAIVIDEQTREIQTIPNPSGTTITMFDYWLNSETAYARQGWPGYSGDGIQNGYYNWQDRHGGDNSGINNGHVLKFVPGSDNTATDYWVYGSSPGYTQNGRVDGINSWNGTWTTGPEYTGEPTTGIVAGALYDGNNVDVNGYPKLNNDLGGESLGYLFDPGNTSASSYRKQYSNVNDFLYVDSQGYYTYDSQYYRVSQLDGTTNRFTVSEQPTDNGEEGYLGFWPMGMRNYWFGMHLQTPFSIPADGKVLNPKGEYQPMQFEFAGDDDAWVYIDGILIADGGGIHNRTELDINFQTGEVLVKGGRYTSITNPNTNEYSRTTLYQVFLNAKNNGLISQQEWDSKYTNTSEKTVWIDTNNDGIFDTFAPGTYHTFDFFYLERGGAESNCYLRYNLITTTDFSAHKSYHSEDNPDTTNLDESRLRRNQYQFELIGFDNTEYAGQTAVVGDDTVDFQNAIMPDAVTHDASMPPGTFENPLWQTVAASGTTGAYRSLIIGNTEDGNVNFGDKEISSAYAGKQYKYIVREVVPDDAENPDGVRWADASEDLREEGGFVLDGITYDSREYYFIGRVVEDPVGSGKYTLKKDRYLDPDYTIRDTETQFFSFVNGEELPLTLKINKQDDEDNPLSGAKFSLTRAMQEEGKWIRRHWTDTTGAEPEEKYSELRTATTVQGALTFNNLIEGHYILEETAAPANYELGDPHRWLLTLTKNDSEDEIVLIPTIQGLNSDGELVGELTTLTADSEKVVEYEILNNPKQIQLSLEKKWVGGAPENVSPRFQLKRYRTYTQPSEVTMVDVYIRYAGDFQSYANGGDNTGYHIRVPANSRVRFGYSGFNAGNNNYVYPWLSEYVGGSGGGHREVLVNGRYDTNYTVGTQEVCFWLFANHGNISPTDNRFNYRLEYVEGTGDMPGPGETITEEDPTFTAQNITVSLPYEDSWTYQFDSYPVTGTNETYNVPETYTYFIEELAPQTEGYTVIYDRMNGEDIAGSTDSEERVITNIKMTDVPLNKTWEWSDDDEGRVDHWDATFVLEYRETLVSGDPADDAQHTWKTVDGVYPKTIHNGDTGNAITFEDLPMFKVHSNGSVYRIIYAVDETAYHVYDSGNNVIARWTKDGSESQIGTRYAPDYEQDAGEGDQPADHSDWPEWYTITLTNVVHETEVTKTIDLAIEKVWEDGATVDDSSYAKFRLRRYVHEEYRDYSKDGIDTSQWVTVTLDLGSGKQSQLTVPKGAPVHISGLAKPGREVNLTFTGPDSTTHAMALDNSASLTQAIADTAAFSPQSDCTITFTEGNTDALIGGLDGIRLACYYDRQTPQIDESFNVEHGGHVDPAGQEFTLNNDNHWQKDWVELPQVVEGKLSGDLQTVYVYSYFLEEIETDPDGYVAIYKNSAGDELGDSYIPVDFSTTITAENVEATEATIRKVWDDNDNDSESRPESLMVTLLADGVRTDHTVTLSEENDWEDTVDDLPKRNGNVEIDYQWLEGEMPAGYFLTSSSTTGTITTITNSLSKYDIKTSYVGTKIWADYNNQYLTRPHELVVTLYADGQPTDYKAVWSEGPDENQWTYTFNDLPVFTESGQIIHYTAVEEPVPGGYKEAHASTPTDGQIGTITYVNGSGRVDSNKITWELGSQIDVAFFAINTSGREDIPVWTHRTPLPSEITEITNAVRSFHGNPNRNIRFYSGTGTVTIENYGSVNVEFDPQDLTVTLDFGSTQVWRDFIVGQFNQNNSSHYEPGTTTFTNTLETTSLEGSKIWAIPAEISHTDPTLKLTRTTTSVDIDGTIIVSEPEVVQVKIGNDMANLQPEWSGNAPTMRSFIYNNLPKYDQQGKEYTYSVEEVSFVIGSGEDAVTYTAVKNNDGTYTVTADKSDAEPFVATQDGNNITNSPLQTAIEIIKVEKGHLDSDHTLSGARFRLTRVKEDDHIWDGYGSYQSEETVDPESGIATFRDVKPGRYRLEELDPPAGFILTDEKEWFININQSGDAAFAISYTMATAAVGSNSFYIQNEPGTALPHTGGIGTTIFYIFGSILVIGCGIYLISRKRIRS